MSETEQKFQQLLQTYGTGDRPSLKEARDWYRAGLTWEQALATCQRGDYLLWAATEMGLLDADAATECACVCVDRLEVLAHDVMDVTAAMRGKGGKVAARHEVMAVEAITERKEKDIAPVDPESALPEPDLDVDVPGASKARYAAARLVEGRPDNVLHHAAMAKAQDARGAWAQALRDGASPVELKALEDAVPRVLAMEHKAHADAVRAALGVES